MTDAHDATVWGALASRAQARPDEEFLKVGDGEWQTYGQLAATAEHLAAGMSAAGVRPGDRVAVLSANRAEVVDVVFGCARLGAIEVPLNYHLKGDFLRYQLEDCSPQAIVCDAEGRALVGGFLAEHPDIISVVLDGEPGPADVAFAALAATGTPAPEAKVAAPDIASIVYTSGTSGLPKGCMLSNGYMYAGGKVVSAVDWVVPGDRMLVAFPHFHVSFLVNSLMSALTNDAQLVYLTEFHASTFMRDAREVGATMIWGLGAMAMAILSRPEDPADLVPTLRMSAMIPLHPERQLEYERRFGGVMNCEAYGQTEANPIVITAPGDPDRDRTASGKPSPLYELRIVDDLDNEVPQGEPGEIVLRPRRPFATFSGYWGKPEATAATFRNLWHHTGDLGFLDDRGRLRFLDRKKDSVRRRGENVSCFELEIAIAQHASVAAVAVTGVPSPLGEDDIKASIVTVNGDPLEPAELFDFFRTSLPYFAIPRYLEFTTHLPSTATGKIRKEQLREEGIHPGLIDLNALGLVVSRDERRTGASV
jgi:carnitine-CoA ligase